MLESQVFSFQKEGFSRVDLIMLVKDSVQKVPFMLLMMNFAFDIG